MAMVKQYYGKVCAKHPELEGLRARPHYRCVECFRAYQRKYQTTVRARAKEVSAQCDLNIAKLLGVNHGNGKSN